MRFGLPVRRTHPVVLPVLLLLVVSCFGEELSVDERYPHDHVLRVNHLQAKGTHNSYHLEPAAPVDDSHRYTMPSLAEQAGQHGIRQFELDLYLDADAGLQVYHIPVVDEETSCLQFADCLQQLKDWSDANEGHHVLFVWIEIKSPVGTELISDWDAFDAAILAVWPQERILRPADVQGGHASLRDAVAADGWPTLGSSRNRIMFLLNNSGLAAEYTEDFARVSERLMFVQGERGNRQVVIHKHPSAGEIASLLSEGYLLGDNGATAGGDMAGVTEAVASAYAQGIHFLASDYPAPTSPGVYVLELGGGAPSRCNPETAPPTCTSADIESLP